MAIINTKIINELLDSRKSSKEEAFEIIFTKCNMRIKNMVDTNQLSTLYTIPSFIFGQPVYNVQDCIVYVQSKLSKNGFITNQILPNVLYISWDPTEIEKEKMKNEFDSTSALKLLEGPTNKINKRGTKKKKILNLA